MGKIKKNGLAGATAIALVALSAMVLTASAALAAEPSPAATPPMGWNSWNHFAARIDDATVRAQADAMVASGMRDAGYRYVNIDDAWEGQRDAAGVIHPNAAAIKTNAALGVAGLEPVKKLVSAAVAKDTADGKTKEAPALLALLELIDKNGSAAVLDAAAPFLTDERAPVAKAALKIFETHAGPYGAKLGSGQECLVWWTVEGKSLIK